MNQQQLIADIEAPYLKEGLTKFEVGDTIDVHCKIIEGSKQRIQVFTGTVLQIRGGGLTQTFTVRKLVNNEGVERVFPIHSPAIDKIDVRRGGHVRRAKLFYLRDRVGKATRLKEKKIDPKTAAARAKAKAEKQQQHAMANA